jgi:hypothetical protein
VLQGDEPEPFDFQANEDEAEPFDFEADDCVLGEGDDLFDFQDDGIDAPLGPGVCVPDEGDDGSQYEALQVSCERSIFIPGVLHVVHNCTKDLSSALSSWDDFVDNLSQVCRLLSRRWTSSRLLSTCFDEMPARAFCEDVGSFHHFVYKGRWGSVLAAVKDLLPLQRALQFAWSLEKFNFGGGAAAHQEQREGEHSLRVETADYAINSNFFWAYVDMIKRIGDALLYLAAWSEGCPCHTDDETLRAPTREQRVRRFKTRFGSATCPMLTRRAPECAAGSLEVIIRRMFEEAQNNILLSHAVAKLSPPERAEVLRDFAEAKRHVFFTMTLKLSFWRQLPWVLFGIGHQNSETARACGHRALQLFYNSADDEVHHWVTLLLCGPGAPHMCSQLLLKFVSAGFMACFCACFEK